MQMSNISTSVNVLKTLHLNSIFNYVMSYAPKKIQLWFDNQRLKIKVQHFGYRLVPQEELKRKYSEALLLLSKNEAAQELGDYLEFGVCHGSSMACMYHALKDAGFDRVRLFGFDSFEGMPDSADAEDGNWYAGQFKSEEKFTRELLKQQDVDLQRVTLVKGWFSDMLNPRLIKQHQITKASVIMIDCDIYSSAKQALDFCAPLIQEQAIIFFDDWNSCDLAEQNKGEKLAFDELLNQNPDLTAEELGSYTETAQWDTSKIFLVSRKS
ncbi:MAG: class I SAM-dependent methyltransferase [Chroococcidiopsidaceae cyanobacterium CP_BM_ER_R8_30]|nr:class I SAM-dependent methyltransferase [Chroococcidiopsidaceae cyanobacterium CP_BM_ER_R8_30]